MAFNADGTAEARLSVFGGLVTEMAPSALPQGVSPDCQDVVFGPGYVNSRPALQRVMGSPLANGITSAKSYINPDTLGTFGGLQNLYLDSGGTLWGENVSVAPGVLTQIASGLAPNSYMKAVTAFGREYLAITDGLHGSDVPLQWDGTNLDRVSQEGPGAAPAIANLALPPSTMATSGGSSLTITSITTINPTTDEFGDTYYAALDITVTSGASNLYPGAVITVSGNSETSFNLTFNVVSVSGDTDIIVGFYAATLTTGTGGTVAFGSVSGTRGNNIVTITTATAHGLQVGYLAGISNVAAQPIGFISQIKIDNIASPGIATITMASAHGLVPDNQVLLLGITAVAIGGATSASRAGGIATYTTASAHSLIPGAMVTTAGISGTAFNGNWIVETIPSPTTYTVTQSIEANSSGTGGTTSLSWPVSPTSEQSTYWTVLETPTTTTFTVALNYSSATWTFSSTANVQFPWNGTFYVTAVPNSTTFQYQQYGPDGTTTSAGTVTPVGQAAPGLHLMQVLFLTRNGAITRPSPSVQFMANGGQYLSVSNIPIGPPDTMARILAFTGASGAYFFYIPVPAQVNGQIVSTATQINDNTTTAVVLDFSDNTLFSAIGISVPGNTPANQIVLDGALGFGYYASRLVTWGQRNCIQNMLSMSFDGGYLAGTTLPLGWDTSNNTGGALVSNAHFGMGWQITLAGVSLRGQLSQSMYQDYTGAPIAQANTRYTFRVWVALGAPVGDVIFNAVISSASTSFSTSVQPTIPNSTLGQWIEFTFPDPTPSTIPSDLIFTIFAEALTSTTTITVDEMKIIYAENPYTDTIFNVSYTNNPEAFDGVSGVMGSTDDTQKLMGMAEVRDTGYALTQDPSGRLHEFSDNGTTEPSGWTFRQIGTNCGLISVFALAVSQADSGSSSGGEQWFSWASITGARIFGGSEAWKISQEIEPDWSGAEAAGALQWSEANGLDPSALLTAWVINDPTERVMYFGLPVRSTS